MDIVYLITDNITNLKYLGSKKNWKGLNTYWGSPNCKSKRMKKYLLQQDWKNNIKNRPETFEFKILESFDNINHIDLLKIELKYQKQFNVVSSMEFINAGFAKKGFCGDTMDCLTDEAKKERKVKISRGLVKTFSKMSKKEKLEKFSRPGKLNPRWKGGISKSSCSCGKIIGGTHNECWECFIKNRDVSGSNNPFYNKTHSDATKKSIGEKRKGKKPSNTRLISIDSIIYNGLNDASKALGIKNTTIWHRIKSNNPKYKDYNYAKLP